MAAFMQERGSRFEGKYSMGAGMAENAHLDTGIGHT